MWGTRAVVVCLTFLGRCPRLAEILISARAEDASAIDWAYDAIIYPQYSRGIPVMRYLEIRSFHDLTFLASGFVNTRTARMRRDNCDFRPYTCTWRKYQVFERSCYAIESRGIFSRILDKRIAAVGDS
jgi:hypothetical protein